MQYIQVASGKKYGSNGGHAFRPILFMKSLIRVAHTFNTLGSESLKEHTQEAVHAQSAIECASDVPTIVVLASSILCAYMQPCHRRSWHVKRYLQQHRCSNHPLCAHVNAPRPGTQGLGPKARDPRPGTQDPRPGQSPGPKAWDHKDKDKLARLATCPSLASAAHEDLHRKGNLLLYLLYFTEKNPVEKIPHKAAQGYLSQNVGRAQGYTKLFLESSLVQSSPRTRVPNILVLHKAFSREKPSAQGLRTRLHKAVCTRLRTRFRTRPAQASESLVRTRLHKGFFCSKIQYLLAFFALLWNRNRFYKSTDVRWWRHHGIFRIRVGQRNLKRYN